MKRVLSIGFLTLLCACGFKYVYYDITLRSVERPSDARERYGNKEIRNAEEEGVKKSYFEDGMVEIAWFLYSQRIAFTLTNKTDHSIKIMWDEGAYVDINGESHRIIHEGVKYIDAANMQPPSTVIRKGFISDSIIPADYIYFDDSKYGGGWKEKPIFPALRYDKKFASIEKEFESKNVQLLLPLQIEDTVNEYIFTFEIEDVILK